MTLPSRRYIARSSVSSAATGGIGTRSARLERLRSSRRSAFCALVGFLRRELISRRSSALRSSAASSRRPSAAASALR